MKIKCFHDTSIISTIGLLLLNVIKLNVIHNHLKKSIAINEAISKLDKKLQKYFCISIY
jgi:hypothetical protein